MAIELLRPNAGGDISQWSGSYTDVDDATPDDDTTVISTSGTGQQSMFNLTDTAIPAGSIINSLTVYFRCRGDANTGDVRARVAMRINGGNVTDTTDLVFSGNSYSLQSKTFTVNPQDGSVWEVGDLNNLQAGPHFQSKTDSTTIRCTQVYVEIDYTVVLGKTSNGSSTTASSTDKKAASLATAPANGTVADMRARVWLSGPDTVPIRGFIYADSGGSPDVLLAVTDDLNITNTTESEVILSFTGANQIALVSGTNYWVGFHWQDPGTVSVTYSRDNTSNLRTEGTDVFTDGTSDPFGTPSLFVGPIDCYVTYTEGPPLPTPASLLNIGSAEGKNHFELQFARSGDATDDKRTQAEIEAGFYEDPYFISNAAGTAVQFWAQMDAPTTSGSNTSRSELRELNPDGTEAGFDALTGQHILHGRFNITHLPPNVPEVMVTQFHDGVTGDRISLSTQLTSGQIKLIWRINGSSSGIPRVSENYVVGTEYEYKIHVSNNTVQLFIDDMVTPFYQSDPDVLVSTGGATWYFKTGNYNDSNETTDDATEYGSTEHRDLYHWHTGWTIPDGRTIDAPLGSTTLTVADSSQSQAVESLLLAAQLSLSDTANGTQNISLTITVGMTDTASGTDALVVAPTLGVVDTGTSLDTVSTSRASSVIDSASASGTSAITTQTQLGDVASSSDSLTISTFLSLAESIIAADTALIRVNVNLIDIADGTDELGLAQAITTTDTLTAAESLTFSANGGLQETTVATDAASVAVSVSLVESIVGVDTTAVTLAIALSDTLMATDSLSIITSTSLSESGQGTDALTLGTPTSIPVSESASGLDAITTHQALPLADTGVLVEAVGAIAIIALSDSAMAIDSLEVSGSASASLSDLATGSETLTVQAKTQLIDTATAADGLLFSRTIPVTDTVVGFESVAIVVMSSVAEASYGTDTVLSTAQLALLEQLVGIDGLVLTPELTPGRIYTGRSAVASGRGGIATGRGSLFANRGVLSSGRGRLVE